MTGGRAAGMGQTSKTRRKVYIRTLLLFFTVFSVRKSGLQNNVSGFNEADVKLFEQRLAVVKSKNGGWRLVLRFR